MCHERTNVDSWDTFFMNVARSASLRSKDPRTQVGACIVSPDNRILSVGYNGTPRGFLDENFPWSSSENPLDSKYGYVVHAEENAILNYKGSLADFNGATIYVTLFPCNECAKSLVQTGIKKIVYLNDSHNGEDANIISKRILDTCGITYVPYECDKINITTSIDESKLQKAEQCLVDNGIDKAETQNVLQALGYILLDEELYSDTKGD